LIKGGAIPPERVREKKTALKSRPAVTDDSKASFSCRGLDEERKERKTKRVRGEEKGQRRKNKAVVGGKKQRGGGWCKVRKTGTIAAKQKREKGSRPKGGWEGDTDKTREVRDKEISISGGGDLERRKGKSKIPGYP